MRVACLTATYPEVEKYLDDFLMSFKAQNQTNIDLVVINDGLEILPARLKHFQLQSIPVLSVSGTPAENRLQGMQFCHDLGYDIVICADADETMHPDRIPRVVQYFERHPQADLVFNNSVYEDNSGQFNLLYKSVLTWQDLLEFNVLGYGAMNIRTSLVPFFNEHADVGVHAFDWWLAMVYLLSHDSVDFLEDATNIYRKHGDNFVGPLTDITDNQIRHALDVKSQFYQRLFSYCNSIQQRDTQILIGSYLKRLSDTETLIQKHGFQVYADSVRSKLGKGKQVYWWQPAMMADELDEHSMINWKL